MFNILINAMSNYTLLELRTNTKTQKY